MTMSIARSLSIAALAIASLDACTGSGCTTAGCGPVAVWTTTLPSWLTTADLAGLRVRACRNDECYEGTPGFVDSDGSGVWTRLSSSDSSAGGPQIVGATSWFTRSDGAWTFRLDWMREGASDGDSYAIDITRGSETIASLRQSGLVYERSLPNGPGCSPTCSETTLTGGGSEE